MRPSHNKCSSSDAGERGRSRRRAPLILLTLALGVLVPASASAFRADTVLRADPFDSQAPVVLSLSPGEGTSLGGTKVTIHGEHLNGVTTVNFGATAVTLSAPNKSASKLEVTTPPGTGVVDVTVSTPEATSEVDPSASFGYTASLPVVSGLGPSRGAASAGTRVKIEGRDFAGATAVHFGSQSATFTVRKSTLIDATAPVATTLGAVNVTVTTPEGTSEVTPADQYTFEAEAPEAVRATPEAGPTAGGNTVTLIGKGFLGTTQVRFGRVPAASFEVLSDGEIEAVPTAHSTEGVAITVTTPEGTSLESCAERDCPEIAHYRFEPPTITSVAPSSGPLAGGTEITVTGTGFSTHKEGTRILIGNREATSITCPSITTCTAITPAGGKAATVPVEVKIPGVLDPSENHSEPSEGAEFTYE